MYGTAENLSNSKKDISDEKLELDTLLEDDFNSVDNLEFNEKKLLYEYTTPILTMDPNRYHNITLVRDRLNGYVLNNNAEFSFNKICGPYGEADGFKKANILLSDGSSAKGYGGGVCQVSTTLYNAVKNLNIDITERHHHSVPVSYVPKDEDATVSMRSDLDFRFKNVSGKDWIFESKSTEDSLTVSVYENS